MSNALSYVEIRAIEKLTKSQLQAKILKWAMSEGRTWVVGGPETWNKEELVRGVCRIEQGEEP